MNEINGNVEENLFERRKREKAKSRREDARRLAAGEVTTQELQEENSIFEEGFFDNVKIDYSNVGK